MTMNFLPAKSRSYYNKCYQDFMKWKMDKKATSCSENVFMRLDKVVYETAIRFVLSIIPTFSPVLCQEEIEKPDSPLSQRNRQLGNWGGLERWHNPYWFTPWKSRYYHGVHIPSPEMTPDWREDEPPWQAFNRLYEQNDYRFDEYVYERDRPFRMSPHSLQVSRWKYWGSNRVAWAWKDFDIEIQQNLGGYCCTAYKRLTPLAGCAVLTSRHIITTATSTELVLRDRRDQKTLVNILGFWYDVDAGVDAVNTSVYGTPSRIHYHPLYMRPTEVNVTHPIPCVFDIAIWATASITHRYTVFSQRANSGWWEYGPTTPKMEDMLYIVGFQFIKSLRRRPTPFIKYAVRTRRWIIPCPKLGWGWFHCVDGDVWGKFGVDSGAAFHRAIRNGWMNHGLAGIGAFSLRLRSTEVVHYFTVLNTHPVLNFIYDAYNGNLDYEYLDYRFYDAKNQAPVPKFWFSIDRYDEGPSKEGLYEHAKNYPFT